jgi:uncharacterized protein YjbI with pentapeptide repeats
VSPRELDELPYARFLRPFTGELEPDGTVDSAHLDGVALEAPDAPGVRFLESAFSSVSVTGGHLGRARFNDVWMRSASWVGTNLAKSVWTDVEVDSGAFAGIELFGAELRRTVFSGCKLDSVNLRGARLHDVTFENCLLRDLDLGAASLTQLRFPGCTIERLHLRESVSKDVDLRHVKDLTIADGAEGLRGTTLTPAQLIDLTPLFAQALGISVGNP